MYEMSESNLNPLEYIYQHYVIISEVSDIILILPFVRKISLNYEPTRYHSE